MYEYHDLLHKMRSGALTPPRPSPIKQLMDEIKNRRQAALQPDALRPSQERPNASRSSQERGFFSNVSDKVKKIAETIIKQRGPKGVWKQGPATVGGNISKEGTLRTSSGLGGLGDPYRYTDEEGNEQVHLPAGGSQKDAMTGFNAGSRFIGDFDRGQVGGMMYAAINNPQLGKYLFKMGVLPEYNGGYEYLGYDPRKD